MVEQTHAWVPYELPSRGRFYGEAIPGGKVEIRKLTVREEGLLQATGIDVLDRMHQVVESCCRLPGDLSYTIPGTTTCYKQHEALLITDRLALLLAQRIITFGPEYSFTWPCRFCRATRKADVNLHTDLEDVSPDVLELRAMERGDAAFKIAEPFPVKLPDSGRTLNLRFLRGGDELAVFRKARKLRLGPTAGVSDVSAAYQIALQIVSIEGSPDFAALDMVRKEIFLRQMTAKDSAAVRIAVRQQETGVDTDLCVNCSSCGATNEVSLQFDVEFFLPSRV
jgi:hypothetical protein